jgi:hypothetical protein
MSDVQFVFPMGPIARALIAVVLGASAVSLAPSADARITKIVLSGPTPAFANASFGNVGAYEQFDGTAYGEVDPLDPLNALIQDIALAPRNSNGKATYTTRVVILRPVQLNQGNGTMLLEIVNRGNKLNPGFFNVGVTTATPQGDGFLEKQGFTLVWVGWQADLVAPTGVDLVTMSAPVAHYSNEDDPITGPVRAEFIVSSPAPSLNIVDNSSSNTPGYATAHRDNSHDTLTMRGHQNDPRVPIPNSNWAYADCSTTPFPGTPNRQKVCLKGGFDSDHIYELLYTARDPIVMGLGLAALRDVGSFLRYAATDDQGTANPLAGAMRYALLNGISQSGRLLRTFLELGFNQDEAHRPVFDGMQPHIGSVRNYINVRFSQPGRLAGTQHTEQQYPGPEGPLTYGDSLDSFTGKQSGLLDRCLATKTCPRIIHTMTDTEYWESSGAFDTVAPDGSADVQIPDNVRIYQFSSTQHGGFSPVAPLSDAAKNNICTQLKNTNSYTYNIRALLVALQQWVASGKTPPDSRYSSLARRSLVPPSALSFPTIAGVTGPNGLWNTRSVYDRGSRYNSADVSGIISVEPPRLVAQYPTLLPQVDADGNDIDGVRSVTLRAPLGTYTGWNVRAAGFSQGDACDLTGAYIPFKATKALRVASSDPRLSLEERYASLTAYTSAATAAAQELVNEGVLLPADQAAAIAAAVSQAQQTGLK